MELQILNKNAETSYSVIDSREVAEMVEKEHGKLLRDIRTYADYLAEANFGLSEFFLESSYRDVNNKEQPCYLITKQGCEMVANKLTGKKGVLFTAKYVKKFNEMETATQHKLPTTFAEALRLAADTAEENEQLKLDNEVKAQLIAEYEPIISYVDTILSAKGTVATTQIAADYGMSAYRMNKTLHELGVQRNVGGQWILYQKHMNNGFTKSETFHFNKSDGSPATTMNTKWTQKGRLFIYDLLKENGILPSIEMETKK